MKSQRIKRVNSLLRVVISEVIKKNVKNPNISELLSVTQVEITPDLHDAKVFISVIGTEEEKIQTIAALNQSAGFISVNASKKVKMRYFPTLGFAIDTAVEKHMQIEKILTDINKEKQSRPKNSDE